MTTILAGSIAYGLAAGIMSGTLIVFFATFLGTRAMAFRRDHRALFEICQWSVYGCYLLTLLAPVWFLQPNTAAPDDVVRGLSVTSLSLVVGLVIGVWLLALIMKRARAGEPASQDPR